MLDAGSTRPDRNGTRLIFTCGVNIRAKTHVKKSTPVTSEVIHGQQFLLKHALANHANSAG